MPTASPCQPSASPPSRVVQPPRGSPTGTFLITGFTLSHVCLFFFSITYWYMMSAPHATCSSQPITTKGLGQHFTSPCKPWNKKKSSNTLPIPGQAFKRQKLLNELNDLLEAQTLEPLSSGITEAVSPLLQPEELLESDSPMELEDISFIDDDQPCSTTAEQTRTSHHTTSSISMYAGWKALIPIIINPFLKYTAAMLGQPLVTLGSQLHSCTSQCLKQKLTLILCLFLDCG